jgi:hypothetical protein
MTERQTAHPMWPDAPITNASHTHKSLRLYQRSLSNTVTTVLHEREELLLDWEGLAGPEGRMGKTIGFGHRVERTGVGVADAVWRARGLCGG